MFDLRNRGLRFGAIVLLDVRLNHGRRSQKLSASLDVLNVDRVLRPIRAEASHTECTALVRNLKFLTDNVLRKSEQLCVERLRLRFHLRRTYFKLQSNLRRAELGSLGSNRQSQLGELNDQNIQGGLVDLSDGAAVETGNRFHINFKLVERVEREIL